jgi:hypothetical protein
MNCAQFWIFFGRDQKTHFQSRPKNRFLAAGFIKLLNEFRSKNLSRGIAKKINQPKVTQIQLFGSSQ